MAKKKQKVDVNCLALDYHCGIYCQLDTAYQMFYSVSQAYLFYRTTSKTTRRNVLADIDIEKVHVAGVTDKLREGWDFKAQRRALLEIFRAKFSQRTDMGKFLIKCSKEDLGKLVHKPCGELDSDQINAALVSTRAKLKRAKQENNGNIPYYSADLED